MRPLLAGLLLLASSTIPLAAHADTFDVMIVTGNGHTWSFDFPTIQNYICTFSNAKVSEISAAKALFGEIPIRGRLPVRLTSATASERVLNRPAFAANVSSRP